MAFDRRLDSPIYAEAIDRAHDLARLIGGEAYLKAKAKEVSGLLVVRESVPDRLLVREGSKHVRYNVSRKTPKAAVRRNVKVADLKAKYPLAYQNVVTISNPEKPYQVRLDAMMGTGGAKEWAEEKAFQAEKLAAELGLRYGEWDFNRPDLQLQSLFELRERAKRYSGKIETARAELALYVCDNELPMSMRGRGDGRLALRENAMVTRVDYDRLEREFPAAASMIKRTTVPASMQIRFDRWVLPADEVDDSDDSGMSRWA